jgi:ubiquinone biosynthesis protein COQ9
MTAYDRIMDQTNETIRDRILETLLPDIAFDGWTWKAAEQATIKAGYDRTMAAAVFPEGLPGVLDHFSCWADRRMLERLASIDTNQLKIRERIESAASARLDVLEPWKEAARLAARYRSVPHRAPHAARLVWRTADCIWQWAGDTSTDYNRYSKRALLAGVLASTAVAWLSERNDSLQDAKAFLHRRIDNAMGLGRLLGKMRKTG